jgi:hypothetical protein
MRRPLAALVAAFPLFAWSAAAPASALAGIEIVDTTQGRTLPVHEYAGRWYVAGEPGHRYELRIRNRTADRVLAVASVDGINVVSGETAAFDQTGYVLDPFSSLEIAGWRKSLNAVARFYFTTLPDSYAARTGRPDEVGAIGIALFRERRQPRRHCCDQLDSSRTQAGSAKREQASSAPLPESKLGTGHGEHQASTARYVDFERASATPQETIVIYYDSRRNLVAQGLIEPLPPDVPVANPFPGSFVRDPPRRAP